jgi:hypothetical protein
LLQNLVAKQAIFEKVAILDADKIQIKLTRRALSECSCWGVAPAKSKLSMGE